MKTNYRIYIILLVVFMFLVIIFCPWILQKWFNIESLNDKALFGNMYWIVTSLFSWLAFLWVIVSLFLQREDLKLTREELKLTRDELVLQRVELERSAKAQEQSEKISRNIAKLNWLSSLMNYSINRKTGLARDLEAMIWEDESRKIQQTIKTIIDELK